MKLIAVSLIKIDATHKRPLEWGGGGLYHSFGNMSCIKMRGLCVLVVVIRLPALDITSKQEISLPASVTNKGYRFCLLESAPIWL